MSTMANSEDPDDKATFSQDLHLWFIQASMSKIQGLFKDF